MNGLEELILSQNRTQAEEYMVLDFQMAVCKMETLSYTPQALQLKECLMREYSLNELQFHTYLNTMREYTFEPR